MKHEALTTSQWRQSYSISFCFTARCGYVRKRKVYFNWIFFLLFFFLHSYVTFVMATFLSYLLPVFLDRNWRIQQDFNYINFFAFVETDLITTKRFIVKRAFHWQNISTSSTLYFNWLYILIDYMFFMIIFSHFLNCKSKLCYMFLYNCMNFFQNTLTILLLMLYIYRIYYSWFATDNTSNYSCCSKMYCYL